MPTQNWRIRYIEDFFFVEADLPNAEEGGFYPRLEVMQEDFGDHNGYTRRLRMEDAVIIAFAPEMLSILQDIAFPKRGSKQEAWTVEDCAAVAANIIARINASISA